MTIALQPLPGDYGKPRPVEYLTSDGKPIAETDVHRDLMLDHIEMFKTRYAYDTNVYVSGNNFIYFEEGSPKRCISPDVYVVFGVAKRRRDCYKAWEEGGRLPDVAIEFTSRKTRREDTLVKLPLYEQVLKTPELFRFDPTGDYLNPPLQGARLVGGRYIPIEPVNGRLYSEVLGLELVPDGENLRLYDPVRQEWLLSPQEQTRRADEEAQRADEEARRADEEAARADEEARRADEQARLRKAGEDEIAHLRAEIEALRRQGT